MIQQIIEVIRDKLSYKYDEDAILDIAKQINKIIEMQKLELNDVNFLGEGQSYITFGVGKFVLKIGSEIKMLNNPYQLLPIHQEIIGDSNQRIYISNRGDTNNITIDDVQNMYNIIRDNGGLWIDPKENNLVRTSEIKDNSNQLSQNVDFYDTGINFVKNNSNIFISDYEDVIFLTQDILLNMDRSSSWSMLPYGRSDNRIYTQYLNSGNIEEIYEKNYIYASKTLLEFEEQYQLSKGNIEKAKKCTERLKEIEKQAKESENRIKKFEKRRNRQGRISELIQRINNAIRRETLKNKKNELDSIETNNYIMDDRSKNKDDDPFRTDDAR